MTEEPIDTLTANIDLASLGFWQQTGKMALRLADNPLFENRGGRLFYGGRHVIHRDSPIEGGVSLGVNMREAIVVDSYNYPLLNSLYGQMLKMASREGVIQRDMILAATYCVTALTFTNRDNDAAMDLARRRGASYDGKIPIDVFIKERIGVCRQAALVDGWMTEKAIIDGHLHGMVSVDRNVRHAWKRYVSSTKAVFISDIMMEYMGLLREASEEHRFIYSRQEDITAEE